MPPRLLARAALALVVCAAAANAEEVDEQPPVTLGLARGFGIAATEQSARLLSNYFTGKLGRRVRATAYMDSDDLAVALVKGNVDFAWLSPAAYVRATKKAPVILVRKSRRHGMPHYRSVIFVRADSAVHRLGDLRGKSIAWGPHGSASGNMVPRAMLLQQKIDLAKMFGQQLELKDHAAVCNAVYTGKVDAGASFSEERPDLADPEVDGCNPAFAGKLGSFRIIATSEPIPNDVFAARAKLDTELVDRVGQLLENLAPEDPILVDGFRCDGFETGNDREFDTLRRALDLASKN